MKGDDGAAFEATSDTLKRLGWTPRFLELADAMELSLDRREAIRRLIDE